MTADAPLILIVEDEAPIRRFLKAALIEQHYRVEEAATGEAALCNLRSQPPDLIILDLGLPDMDGARIIDEVRGWSELPILILSARDQQADKVDALDRGADDYLSKPFGVPELLARMRVVFRRRARASAGGGGPPTTLYQSDDLRVDLEARIVFVAGREVHLTPIEFRLLTALIRHAGKVLTHRFLLREVWGPGYAEEVHQLRVHMANLRRKVEADPARPRHILTEQGVGYRLAED